jgi:hypothetical protein
MVQGSVRAIRADQNTLAFQTETSTVADEWWEAPQAIQEYADQMFLFVADKESFQYSKSEFGKLGWADGSVSATLL